MKSFYRYHAYTVSSNADRFLFIASYRGGGHVYPFPPGGQGQGIYVRRESKLCFFFLLLFNRQGYPVFFSRGYPVFYSADHGGIDLKRML